MLRSSRPFVCCTPPARSPPWTHRLGAPPGARPTSSLSSAPDSQRASGRMAAPASPWEPSALRGRRGTARGRRGTWRSSTYVATRGHLRHRPPPPPNGGSIGSTCAHVIAASEAANNGDGMAGELAAQTHCALTHKLRPVHTSGCRSHPPPRRPGPFPDLNLSPAGTGARHLNDDDACAGTGRKSNPRRGGPERVHPRLLCA